ncbi:hypothetical protein BaRGS_00013081 [Batillaria attramentaria]|uniref:Timeless C-terminal domain-containing protein n=1 Tax=Batillaria attramentaria TaxID=370345 RepID=A0ABD0L8A1_9CAEN
MSDVVVVIESISDDPEPCHPFVCQRARDTETLGHPGTCDLVILFVKEQRSAGSRKQNKCMEEEEVAAVQSFEQEFDLMGYLNCYAKPEILKNYVLLAADFEKNSTHTNHCVAKMLHRIGFDMGYTGMLFQASLFRVFQRIMLGPPAKSPRFKELYKFAVHVVRKFSEVGQKNKKVFMEMLFWKGSKEAMQITEGYDYNPGGCKAAWTEQEENELMRLFEDFRDNNDAEKDTVDLILERWTGQPKSRSQILRQLKNLHLIESAKDLKKKPVATRAWTTEDEQELERIYHEFKDSSDPLGNIVTALSKKRSKQKVAEKLLALDLVQDRKELHKKRGKKGSEPRRSRRLGGDDDSEREDINLSDLEEGRNLPTDEDSLSSGASDVPIVPLTEDNETAMEDPVFVELLQGVGLSPPANEQEMFWRIPADLTPANLRNLGEALTLDADGKPIHPEILAQIRRAPTSKRADSDSDDSASVSSSRSLENSKKTKRRQERRTSRSEQEGEQEQAAGMSVDDVDSSDGEHGGDGSDVERSVDRNKAPTATQRREALKAMLERRKDRKVMNRDKSSRARENTVNGGASEAREEAGTGMEQDGSLPDIPPQGASPSHSKSKKRLCTRSMFSVAILNLQYACQDSGDDRLVIDDDGGVSDPSPKKPASKRARLLDSDLSEEEKENKDTSTLSFMSGEILGLSGQWDGFGEQVQGSSENSDDDVPLDKMENAGDDDSDDDVPLTELKRSEANGPESFPATLYTQGPPGSDDSDLDDHVPLGKIVKKSQKILSDDEDD